MWVLIILLIPMVIILKSAKSGSWAFRSRRK